MNVVVIELYKNEDGSTHLGNSVELPLEEAIVKIQAGEAKSELAAIGVVPDEWTASTKEETE